MSTDKIKVYFDEEQRIYSTDGWEQCLKSSAQLPKTLLELLADVEIYKLKQYFRKSKNVKL